MGPERLDLSSERLDLRPEGSDEGGTNGRTNGRTKVPLCSTGLRPLRGRCPKRLTMHLGRSINAVNARKCQKDNSSPKGNMWSAIPVALLCMIVKWSERKQGSGPKGDEVL